MDNLYTERRDPRLGAKSERITPTKDLKEVHIGPLPHQVTKPDTSLSVFEEEDLIALLRRNIDLLAWTPSDIPGINTRVVCHLLSIYPSVKPVS